MPTFYDPGADAGEVSALRGLALAGSGFEHPQDMYGVFGDLLHGVRSLRQVLDQLSTAHLSNRPRAFDNSGDHLAGSKDALATANALRQTAMLIDQAEERISVAMSAAGRILWRAEPSQDPVTVYRWVSVCFLQSEEADEVLK